MLLIVLSWEQPNCVTSKNTSRVYQVSAPGDWVPVFKFKLYHSQVQGDGGKATHTFNLSKRVAWDQ